MDRFEENLALKMSAQEVAKILGTRANGELREMVRALTLFPWFNTAVDAKPREPALWALTNWKEYQDDACAAATSDMAKVIIVRNGESSAAVRVQLRNMLDGAKAA
jgi:hypothetical protein